MTQHQQTNVSEPITVLRSQGTFFNRQSKIYVTTGACLEEKRSVLQQCTDSDLGQKSRHPQ